MVYRLDCFTYGSQSRIKKATLKKASLNNSIPGYGSLLKTRLKTSFDIQGLKLPEKVCIFAYHSCNFINLLPDEKNLIVLLSVFWAIHTHAQKDNIQLQSTIKADAGDTKEMIQAKAAHVIPTPNQLSALKNEFIAFVHFGPNAFTQMEWGNGMEDPKVFDLKELHTDQWCEAMKAAGMKMVILTVKHHD